MLKFGKTSYKTTQEFWKGKHSNKAYSESENNQKNNEISRTLIEKFLPELEGVESILELELGSGRNINIFLNHFPDAQFYGNDISPNIIEYISSYYPNVTENCRITSQDTCSFVKTCPEVDVVFTHGHLMHIPDDAIEEVCNDIQRVSRKFILIREAYVNNKGAGLIRTLNYRKYRFDRDYSEYFPGFTLSSLEIKDHHSKKWVRQGEYLFTKIV